MRTVSNLSEPLALTEWRARAQGDVNFNYENMPTDVRAKVKESLVDAQRGLCAYTGIPVDPPSSHIEHLTPQARCARGVDVSYRNMVACFPGPGMGYVPFGAQRKADWPSTPEQSLLFVSPRLPGCEGRFAFSIQGMVAPTPGEGEAAVRETIRRLGLDHPQLIARRRAAVDAAIAGLGAKALNQRLSKLRRDDLGSGRLEPYCFVLKQAITKQLKRLEAIRESVRRGRRR